ncbi:glycosyltransferase family 4 protein [uncultured Methanobacterium sp.]|uniref:glycosyltransferase family 4 protein n=1 Tax=uncultured Methanobacterium sp. TaxID=176306 RepID=UPI002AA68FC3|nr:glycosyltransferase family 4 protein [uncultured Methanobacterium sp.]
MKISYLLLGLGKRGGTLVLYNFMDHLVSRGHEVYAILPNKRIKWEVGIWKSITEKESLIKTIFLYLKAYLNPFSQDINHLSNGLIKNWVESDITVATFCFTAYAGYYLSDKTLSLYHMQHLDEIFLHSKKDRLIARNTYYLPIIKISNSKWLKNVLQEKFNQESYLLNPGIDTKTFRPYIDPQEKYKEKKVWNMVSYFNESDKWKGFADAVKAVKKAREHLQKNNIKLNWSVYGIEHPFKLYETEFKYLGPVFGDDLAKLYSQADLVLLASWYESFPLPPIEAMACGSVIITTRYGTEDYVFDGENGLVCLPREIDEIAAKIIQAIENPEECLKMSLEGLKTAQRFDWEKRTDDLERIFKDALNNNSINNFEFFDDMQNSSKD